MSTPIGLWYRPLRIMLGDLDATVRRYSDGVLSDGVKTCIQLNKLPTYALTVDESGISPEITDPNKFALVSYHTAKLFVAPAPAKYAFKTRAFSESFGSLQDFLRVLENEIHKLENGVAFTGWYNYFTWLSGMAGLPLAEVLTDMHAESPLWHATLTREGVRTLPSV